MGDFKSNNNIVYCCQYHVVWVTKYRRSVLTEDVQQRLKELLTQIAKEINVEILSVQDKK
jgi:putative transposase